MKALKWLGGAILALLLLVLAVFWWSDSRWGHDFVRARIAALAPANGLKIRIGSIDGSIYGASTLHDVELLDPKGVFLRVPEMALDWRPLAWQFNKLEIESVTAPTARLLRVPVFNQTASTGPTLPDFDIHIGKLQVDRLIVEPAVSGQQRIGAIHGQADIHAGRALVDLNADIVGGDKVAVKLDAEPDRNKFDLASNIDAPAGGVIGALAGMTKPFVLNITGNGNWTDWRGVLAGTLAGKPFAQLDLTARQGRYDVIGTIAPSQLLSGKLASLTAPQLRVTGNARLTDRRLDTHVTLGGNAFATTANGIVDLRYSRFDGMKIDTRLLQPSALFPQMRGNNVRLQLLLDGAFRTARFDYLLTADQAQFDTTGFDVVRASGQGRLSALPLTIPLNLTARRVTGVGSVAGGLLTNVSVTGPIRVSDTMLSGDGLLVRSDKLNGRITLLVDFRTGRYDVGLNGKLNHYEIPGLGLVDLTSELRVVPGPNGQGIRVIGRGEAWVRRLDNAFLAGLAGGLPHVVTGLERDANGVIHFVNLHLTGPAINITGNGYRRLDGTFHFEGQGVQRQYGPVRLILDGPIERPKLDLILLRPMEGMKLRDVHATLVPTASGYTWQASGGSIIGPFTGNGAILLPKGAATVIQVARLNASGLIAAGALSPVSGGIQGKLTISGEVNGSLAFRPERGVQRIDAHLVARDTKLVGPPVIVARRGTIDAVVLLEPRGPTIDATVQGEGLRYGNIALARLAGNAKFQNGSGTFRGAIAGSRGRSFDLQTVAQFTPDRITAIAEGTIDGKPVKLDAPATLISANGGWQLTPLNLQYAGGTARIAGRFDNRATEVNAEITRMPLGILDIVSPGLRLGGLASGRINYSAVGDAAPTGRIDVRVRGMTRAGLVLASQPVDVGLIAAIDGNGAGMRAVAVSGGQTVGQAQARIAPLARGASLVDRLMHSPLFAQLRYNGPTDTLWRLTGIDGLDVSGPAAIGADITGTMSNPQIRGSVQTSALRIESPISGTVVSGIRARGDFNGSRLVVDNFTGTAGKGTITGRATFDLAAASGFGMAIDADTRNADLLRRDDISATITGPLTVRSSGGTGTISGKLLLDRSAFRLGRATAAAAVPQLRVRELNRRIDAGTVRSAPTLWLLDIDANAPNRLMVTGLGLDSEWSSTLHIGGSLDAMQITGDAQVLRGGYEFAGKRFELTRGVIRFTGATIDPVVDIAADANVNSIAATVRVTGTAQKPNITFTSVPALPQDELLSRLLFGTSITNLSAPEALQLAAAVASLRDPSGGLNPINALRQAIGLDRLRILSADATTGNKTAIAAGKYITRRTFIEIISDGQGYSATRIEFQITRWLSLLSSISTIGRTTATVRVQKDY